MNQLIFDHFAPDNAPFRPNWLHWRSPNLKYDTRPQLSCYLR